MPRKRVPTVGADALNIVQVSPRVRKIEARRTRRAARRESAPIIAADKAALAGIRGSYQDTAASAKGAVGAVQGSLLEALQGLKGNSGLTGKYKQQVQSEFTERSADAAQALPALLVGAAEERDQALLEGRQQLTEDRAARDSSAAAALNQRLKELRTAGGSALKEREDELKPDESDKRSLENAANALRDSLSTWQENPTVEGPDGQEVPLKQLNPLQTPEDWRRFAHGLEKEYGGFDLTDAMTVIQEMLKNRKRLEHQGRVPQAGVPSGPRQDFGLGE